VDGLRLIVWRVLLIGLFVSASVNTPAAALDPRRSIDQLLHRAYTQDDGLTGGVHAITQAPDGYLWVGSDSERIGGRLQVASREGLGTEVVMSAPARVAYKTRRPWPFDRYFANPLGETP
jgi:hypothetical protein